MSDEREISFLLVNGYMMRSLYLFFLGRTPQRESLGVLGGAVSMCRIWFIFLCFALRK